MWSNSLPRETSSSHESRHTRLYNVVHHSAAAAAALRCHPVVRAVVCTLLWYSCSLRDETDDEGMTGVGGKDWGEKSGQKAGSRWSGQKAGSGWRGHGGATEGLRGDAVLHTSSPLCEERLFVNLHRPSAGERGIAAVLGVPVLVGLVAVPGAEARRRVRPCTFATQSRRLV